MIITYLRLLRIEKLNFIVCLLILNVKTIFNKITNENIKLKNFYIVHFIYITRHKGFTKKK